MVTLRDALKKIADFIWEIPRAHRAQMRVPARVLASEKMLNEISRDRSLAQLVNVAALPGIETRALCMPDVHEGYGFPVGGVAAFDTNKGIISPGGIGYDINCLHPDTSVALSFGARAPIKALVEPTYRDVAVTLLNKNSARFDQGFIKHFLWRYHQGRLLKITTRCGFSLKVTGEHPVYTPAGLTPADKLGVGQTLCLDPFRGPLYQQPTTETIINESAFKSVFQTRQFSSADNRWRQIKGWLKKKDLLTIRYNSPALPFLIKILGFVLGDGTMNFVGQAGKGRLSFYGKISDLQKLKADLAKIGIRSYLHSRRREHTLTTRYQKTYFFSVIESSLHVCSSAFVLLLAALGGPLGNKTRIPFGVPAWLKRSPLWQKRLFLAAFFGAEMSRPATVNNFNFNRPTLNINKQKGLSENGRTFLTEIRSLMAEFKIKTSPVSAVPGLGNKGTVGWRFHILGATGNLRRFFETVAFEYNQEKQALARVAAAYLRFKEKILRQRRLVRQTVRQHYAAHVPASQLANQYASAYTPHQFIEHSLWSAGRAEPRIANNFPSFNNFISQTCFGPNGFIKDEIESIELIPYTGKVYDLTINHPHHNFIADNFVVSNCGVRLLKSALKQAEVESHLEKLGEAIYREVPSGVGKSGPVKLSTPELDKVLKQGARQAVALGFGEPADLERIESGGVLEAAEPALVSDRAKARGADQLGTLGAGNHFVEVERVEKIFDPAAAQALGLFENQVTVLIHTGSRGLGHQIATDYIAIMMRAMAKYGIILPDRELAGAPFKSPEGQNYFKAMSAGANFAWANRQLITQAVRKAWRKVLGEPGGPLAIVYDVAHNIAKIEEYEIDGVKKMVVVHRKGATRAFPNQPVLIPGSMGTASYVLIGQTESLKQSFGSTCHGAGRRLSRTQAKREVWGADLKTKLAQEGIVVKAGSLAGLAEEAPQAYKDVNQVVEVVHRLGIATKVARLKPLAVIKG